MWRARVDPHRGLDRLAGNREEREPLGPQEHHFEGVEPGGGTARDCQDQRGSGRGLAIRSGPKCGH